jgi:hypothetical protein
MNSVENCSFKMQILHTSVDPIPSQYQRGKDILGSLEDFNVI